MLLLRLLNMARIAQTIGFYLQLIVDNAGEYEEYSQAVGCFRGCMLPVRTEEH
jgi:hypothetical protein